MCNYKEENKTDSNVEKLCQKCEGEDNKKQSKQDCCGNKGVHCCGRCGSKYGKCHTK